MTIRIQPWQLWMAANDLLEETAGEKRALDADAMSSLPPRIRASLGGRSRKKPLPLDEAQERLRADRELDTLWTVAAGTGRSSHTLSRAEVKAIGDPTLRVLTLQLWDKAAAVCRRNDPPRVNLLHDLDAPLAQIFSASVVDICAHHNQALDAFDEARRQGLVAKDRPLTLVHCDTHSDMYREADAGQSDTPTDIYSKPRANSENIGNYINRLVRNGEVDTVYWVVPDVTREDPALRSLFWHPTSTAAVRIFNDGPADQTFWVDPDSGELSFDDPPVAEQHRYRTVQFHKVVLAELPDFTGRADLWLDIDADYFANSGNDTYGMAHIPYEGRAGLRRFVERLAHKGCRPALTTCALSSSYTTMSVQGEVARFFHAIARNSSTGDLLVGHHHNAPQARSAGHHRGSNVPRTASKAYQLLAELARIDAETYRPDQRVPLAPSQPEAQKARLVAEKLLGDAAKASRILDMLNRYDGVDDRWIDIERLAERLQIDPTLRADLEGAVA